MVRTVCTLYERLKELCTAKEQNDPYIALAKKGLRDFNEAEGFFLVNALPWLRYLLSWFPGASFHKKAKEGYNISMAMYNEPLRLAKEIIVSGMSMTDFTAPDL